MDLRTRAIEEEIMDDLSCSGEVVNQTLRELEVINKWLGGNAVTINALDRLLRKVPEKKSLIIADLGCGGGDMLRLISRWAEKKNISVTLIGFDANPNIIRYARQNLDSHHVAGVEFRAMDIFSTEFREQNFDIVIGTLFFHHFDDQQLVSFFSRLRTQVSIGIIINDIHRHFLAYHSIKWITGIFSKSAMVKFDAPLSVRRAFRKPELEWVFRNAGYKLWDIRWKWAFRWQVILWMYR